MREIFPNEVMPGIVEERLRIVGEMYGNKAGEPEVDAAVERE